MTDSSTLIPLNQNKDKTSPSPNNSNNTNTKFLSPSASVSPSPKQNKINHKKRPRENKNSKNEPPQKKRKFNGKLSDKIGKMIEENKALKQNNKLLKTEHAKKEKLLLQKNKILMRQNKALQEQNDKYASVFNQVMNVMNIKNNNNHQIDMNKVEQFSLIELAHKYKKPVNRNKMPNLVCYECKGNNMNDMNNYIGQKRSYHDLYITSANNTSCMNMINDTANSTNIPFYSQHNSNDNIYQSNDCSFSKRQRFDETQTYNQTYNPYTYDPCDNNQHIYRHTYDPCDNNQHIYRHTYDPCDN
eukprot:180513_1